jgi:hypothetical protein
MDKAALPIVRAKELATSSVAVDIEAPISGGHVFVNTKTIAVSAMLLYASLALSNEPVLLDCTSSKGEETYLWLSPPRPFEATEYSCPGNESCKTKRYVVDKNDGWSIDATHYTRTLVNERNVMFGIEGIRNTSISITRATGEYEMRWDEDVGLNRTIGKEWGTCREVAAPKSRF